MLFVVLIVVVIFVVFVCVWVVIGDFWFDEIWFFFCVLELFLFMEILIEIYYDNNYIFNFFYLYLFGFKDNWILYCILVVVVGMLIVIMVGVIVRWWGWWEVFIVVFLIGFLYLMIYYFLEV